MKSRKQVNEKFKMIKSPWEDAGDKVSRVKIGSLWESDNAIDIIAAPAVWRQYITFLINESRYPRICPE